MSTAKNKILIVEDDDVVAHSMVDLLTSAGYQPAHFYDANSALEWLKAHEVELIISDLGLPGISGIQFCKLLKENSVTSETPIIMLTGAGDEAHKVEGLKSGADDYVVKPFAGKEFLARIEAVLRRYHHHGHTERELSAGALTLNLDTGEAHLKKKKLDLNPKEYSMLVMFLKKPGRILSYAHIGEEVWGLESVASKDTIKVTVHRLREKLGLYGDYIEPVSGQGYKWNPPHNH